MSGNEGKRSGGAKKKKKKFFLKFFFSAKKKLFFNKLCYQLVCSTAGPVSKRAHPHTRRDVGSYQLKQSGFTLMPAAGDLKQPDAPPVD